MACGGGLWLVAVVATALLVFIQWLLHRKWRVFQSRKNYSIKIIFTQEKDEREKVKQLFDIDRYNRLIVERKDGRLVYQAKLDTEKEYSSMQLDEIMHENPFILSIERVDDN